jgi:hypothetical protein
VHVFSVELQRQAFVIYFHSNITRNWVFTFTPRPPLLPENENRSALDRQAKST